MKRIKLDCVLVMAALTFIHQASAAPFSETSGGDLSNDPHAPDTLVLSAGSNLVSGGFGGGDPADFLTVVLPPGHALTSILLGEGTIIGSNSSFIGIASGSQIASTSSAAGLLGWTHFRSTQANTDLLDDMSTGVGAIGFTPPLASGTYTLWMQELSGDANLGYELDLQVAPVPLPSALWSFATGLLMVGRRLGLGKRVRNPDISGLNSAASNVYG